MAPEIDGKLYLTDIELPGGEVAEAGDIARVEITKTDAYDLVAGSPRFCAGQPQGPAQALCQCRDCGRRKTSSDRHWGTPPRPGLSYTLLSKITLRRLLRFL